MLYVATACFETGGTLKLYQCHCHVFMLLNAAKVIGSTGHNDNAY